MEYPIVAVFLMVVGLGQSLHRRHRASSLLGQPEETYFGEFNPCSGSSQSLQYLPPITRTFYHPGPSQQFGGGSPIRAHTIIEPTSFPLNSYGAPLTLLGGPFGLGQGTGSQPCASTLGTTFSGRLAFGSPLGSTCSGRLDLGSPIGTTCSGRLDLGGLQGTTIFGPGGDFKPSATLPTIHLPQSGTCQHRLF